MAGLDALRTLPGYVYLATPYSRFDGGIGAAFRAACKLTALLISERVAVYSPIAHSHWVALHGGLDPMDHSIWLDADRPMMDRASALVIADLQGWRESRGVKHEIDAFDKARKPIWIINPVSLDLTIHLHDAPTERGRYIGLDRTAEVI